MNDEKFHGFAVGWVGGLAFGILPTMLFRGDGVLAFIVGMIGFLVFTGLWRLVDRVEQP